MYLQRLAIISIIIALVIIVIPVKAETVPEFSHCINPQGTIITSHPQGTHAVVGDQSSYTGIDTVYRIGDTAFMQCLCTVSGSGIQTNWWKIDDSQDPDVITALRRGWIHVPD